MIEDSLKNRKHVVEYDEEIIPSKQEIDEILRTAYPLVTSKQKGYPYRVHVIGPNRERSIALWNLCEGNKIETDLVGMGEQDPSTYRQNEGLYHMYNAPYTLIYTPRVAPPNPYQHQAFAGSNSKWELDDAEFVDKRNRETCGVDVGMLAKAITGATLDRGWDTSYNVCFPKKLEMWMPHFPFLEFRPTLIQTIGKGKKYKYQTLSPAQSKLDTDAPFETIFHYSDN
jgi:hypothetical protein